MQNIDYDFEARKKRRGDLSLDPLIAKKNLETLKEVFDKHSIRFWLVFGTLLGAYRDGAFIPHDTDTDIGAFFEDKEKIIEAYSDLQKNGFELIRAKPHGQLITFMRDDEYIDIGLFKIKRDMFLKRCWYYGSNRVYGNHFERFDTISFLGREYLVPNEVEGLLKQWYGLSWSESQKNRPADLPTSYPMIRKFFGIVFYPLPIFFKVCRRLTKS